MKTKEQNLLLISHEKRICNKIHAVLKDLFKVQLCNLFQNELGQAKISNTQIILLIGLQSPEDVYAKLRLLNQYKAVPPIILISDINNMHFLARTLNYGVVRFIAVPLDLIELIQTINQLLKKVESPTVSQSASGAAVLWSRLLPSMGSKVVTETTEVIFRPSVLGTQVGPENIGFLNIQFFGKLRINLQNQYIENLFSKKTKAMLAFMLYHHKKPICREKLISIFWPYHNPNQAKNNLNVAIHKIRKDFLQIFPNTPIFHLENDCYLFNANIIIQTDIEQFEEKYRYSKAILQTVSASKAIEEFQAVISIYQGEFLEGIYEPWVEQKREHFRELYLLSLNNLSTIFLKLGQYLEAIKYNKLMLEEDACMEDVHRKLMVCYHSLGRHTKVMRQFKKCEKILQKELGMNPSKQTVDLLEKLRA